METTQQTDRARQAQTADPVYLENTLLRIFGVLFCHDPKRARTRTGTIDINRGVKERGISVRFDPEYAQPGPFAHKATLAIIRKQSLYGRPIRKEISFSQRELIRLSGRSSWSGRSSEELALALKQIRYTHVLAHFKQNDRFVERDFSIFNEVIIERRASPTDPIVACTVVLADPIVQSLNDNHFTCLNHGVLEQLGTIGQALFIRLFFHFSTHYDGHHESRVTFKKRYDDICGEWLGGLSVLKFRSKILGEQLGRHLDQLVSVGFLASYTLAPAANGDGFVFTFRPGKTFFVDYQQFYVRRSRGHARFEFNEDQQTVGEPHRVAVLFAEKRSGRKPDGIPYVSSKDVETAKDLLGRISLSEIPNFLDHALAEASRTNFNIQTLGGVKQYLNDYLQARQHRAAAKSKAGAVQGAMERYDADRIAYDRFYRAKAHELFDSLSEEEQHAIEALARSRTPSYASKPGSSVEPFFVLTRDRITVQRFPGRIPSFEEWRNQRTA